jgi:hypothetical protein
MNTTELTRALREATEDVALPPGFTGAVLRGGRRRQNRRRLAVATGVTAVTTIAGAGTYVWLAPDPAVVQTADPRLSQPTRGDLATDRDFVNAAARAWRDGVAAARWTFTELRGASHVYWAGNTPAGPAAIVMQQAGQVSAGDADPHAAVSGLVARDPADGKLKLVATHYDSVKQRDAGTYLFGRGDRTVLIVDWGTPLYLSPSADLIDDGRIIRSWQRLPVTGGVAIGQLPDGADPSGARILAQNNSPAPTDKDITNQLHPAKASEYLRIASRTGDITVDGDHYPAPIWHGENVARQTGKATGLSDPLDVFQRALAKAGMLDDLYGGVINGQWSVTAGLPDGRMAIVSERVLVNQPSNTLFAVILAPSGAVERILPAGQANAAALPLTVHLPDGQGWLVIDYGATLAYRTSRTTPWQPATADAALLPENALEVQITTGSAATIHQL